MAQKIELEIPPILGLDNDYSFIEEIYGNTWGNLNPPVYDEKVSIIIPVYNRKEILGKTLAGILHQSYPLNLIEVIIADDGSSDHPEELIAKFEPFFSIKYVSQEDLGFRASAVRNLGVSESSNENLIFLDCDMLPLPNLIESMMKWLYVSKKVILIGHRRFVSTDAFSIDQCIETIEPLIDLPDINSENKVVKKGSKGVTVDWREKIYSETNQLKSAGAHVFRTFCSGNVGFSRDVWDQIGGFDEDFNHWGGEDTEFGFRAYNNGNWFVPVHEALALHQEPPGGENETDRIEGKMITHEILVEKCPSRYRKYEKNRQYQVPKVSVFVPAYNCQDFIEEALFSVLNQSFSDFEILVTDDGGTDNTAKLVLQLAEMDSRIRFYPKTNGGIGSACNHMLSFAKGEYALQLDGDDVLAPDTIEKMVDVLDNVSIGFVYGDAFLVDRNLNFKKRSYSWSNYDRQKMINGGMHIHPPRMFRMRDYNRTLKYDEQLENAVDFDFFLKLAEVSDGYHLQRGFYLYRKHGSNTSDIRTEKQTENTHIAISRSVKRLGIKSMVDLIPNKDNPRRMHVVPNSEMDALIDCDEFYRRFGIREELTEKFNIHDLENMCDPSISLRISKVTATSSMKRRIRIGPFNDPSDLLEAREIIKENRGWNLHYQSITTNLDSGLILVTGHFSNESSAQNASTFLRNIGLRSEIIVNQREHPFAYPSYDTVGDIKEMTAKAQKPKKDESKLSSKEGKFTQKYDPSERWHFESGRLWLTYKDLEIWFEMPKEWKFEETHPDLFKVSEFVLLSPYEPNILENWEPSRRPGIRPGLAFSAGVDSTAAMCLMPDRTLLFYHERSGIDSIMNHENANRFINHLIEEEGRPVIRVKSNHEISRTIGGKSPGFTTDYACAVHVILLADHYDLDSVATGMPLENSYLFHGQTFRNFEETHFWKKHSKLFDSIGLPIYQPVMGCSELVNRNIVDLHGYGGFAQSCLRAPAGTSCGRCWKCFRKNTLIGNPFQMSNEISTFLSKKPLKMAASTIYSIQKLQERGLADEILLDHEHIKELIDMDVSFLEGYYPPSLELIPEKYRKVTENLLFESVEEMKKVEDFENFAVEQLIANDK